MKIYEAINKALALWMEATGRDLKDDPNSIDFHFHTWDGTIRESQDLDPTALTSFMVLRSTAREFASTQEFSGLEILEAPDAVLARTAKLRELLRVLNDPECAAEVEKWQAYLKESAKVAKLEKTADKAIEDVQELAYIRRDALRAFQSLRVHHFRNGKRGAGKAKYNEWVVKFWNMNSVVQAAQQQPEDGVTMVMVRDPVDLFSYFCFLVVNGENITIVSDLPDQPHPHHKYMSRGRAQERHFESRAARLRFPYQLFDFEFNDDGKFKGEKVKNALSPVNTNAVLVKKIADLESDQALWAMMMFDLLAEQYWRQEQKPVVLSYLGAGMTQKALEGPQSKALILPGMAALSPLTREDMHRDKLGKVWEHEPSGFNNWMEDRYGPLIPEKAFNLIGIEKVHRLLDGSAIKPGKLIPKTDKDVELNILNTNTYGGRNTDMTLSGVEPTSFGTPEEMERDRLYIARSNQANLIMAEAVKEFSRRKDEVVGWYKDRVEKNKDFLLDCVAKGSLISEIQGYLKKQKGELDISSGNAVPQSGEILSQWTNKSGAWPYSYGTQVKLFRMNERRSKYLCWLTSMTASIWTHFHPWTPVSLSVLAGCKVEELPDVLQHWYRNEPYTGNMILNRVDPMDWKLVNPWRGLNLSVLIGLSKRAFNRVLKDRGVTKREPPYKAER